MSDKWTDEAIRRAAFQRSRPLATTLADAAFAVAGQMRDELQAQLDACECRLIAANAQRDRCHNELMMLRNAAVAALEFVADTTPEDQEALLAWRRGCSQ